MRLLITVAILLAGSLVAGLFLLTRERTVAGPAAPPSTVAPTVAAATGSPPATSRAVAAEHMLTWLARAADTADAIPAQAPRSRALLYVASSYGDLGRMDLRAPILPRLAADDRKRLDAFDVADDFKKDPAAAFEGAARIADPKLHDQAMMLIRHHALRAGDLASANRSAQLCADSFCRSLAYDSICEYQVRRGDLPAARAAAAKIEDSGYQNINRRRIVIAAAVASGVAPDALVPTVARDGVDAKDFAHGIAEFVGREAGAGRLDRAEQFARQVTDPFQLSTQLDMVAIEAFKHGDAARYRRLMDDALGLVARCDADFAPLLVQSLRIARTECGDAAAVVAEIRADKDQAQALVELKWVDAGLLKALVWAGRPAEAIATERLDVDKFLSMPGGLPATLAYKGYDAEIERWWSSLTDPEHRTNIALGAAVGWAQLAEPNQGQ